MFLNNFYFNLSDFVTLYHTWSCDTGCAWITPTLPENPKHFVPEISRTLGARAWKQVVMDWDEKGLTQAHHVPLKDWDPEWHRSTGESVKYGQRRRIALNGEIDMSLY